MTVAAYVDPESGEQYSLDAPRWCSDVGGSPRPLMLTPGNGITPSDFDTSARGIWRYRAALPVTVASPITLGGGATPLIESRLGGGMPRLKLEWFSPSGSFKDRGSSVMLSVLRAQGVHAVIEDSSGNGGASIAAYAAAGGLDATIYAPSSTSPSKLMQVRAYGARIELVEGPRERSQAAAISAAERSGACYASHNWQAWFLEGTKSLAYELWEDGNGELPEVIIMPVGAGSLLLGCAIGFAEMLRSGMISRMPRLFAAQPLNCSPIDAAFHVKLPREVLPTMAEGTAFAAPLRQRQILAALRASGGGSCAVTEEEIRAAHVELASQGLYAEPTSATAAAAYRKLLAAGTVPGGATTVVVLTGTGLKAAPTAPQ